MYVWNVCRYFIHYMRLYIATNWSSSKSQVTTPSLRTDLCLEDQIQASDTRYLSRHTLMSLARHWSMGTSSGPTISTAVLTPQQLWLATLKKWSYNSPNISPSGTLHSFEYFSPENVLFSESQTSQSSWKIPILSWFINFKRKSAETTSSKQTSSFDKRNKFFQSTQGEVYFNEATCPVFKVDINNAIPTFTFGFIEGEFSI